MSKEEQIETKRISRILLDFDGTCLTNENYPRLGREIGAIPVLKALVANGHYLILWTRRSGDDLKIALKWFENNNIPLRDVNPDNKTKPVYDLIIDRKALNAPLTTPKDELPYINWTQVKGLLQNKKLI